jgi:coenzyme F420-reducing hydrogenase delta subunit
VGNRREPLLCCNTALDAVPMQQATRTEHQPQCRLVHTRCMPRATAAAVAVLNLFSPTGCDARVVRVRR